MSIRETYRFIDNLEMSPREHAIARQVILEIKLRLQFLIDVGLDYLTLHRPAGSLSGGEAQRIRLATQVGSSLVGVLYVLDEPSIGLHPRDNGRLLATLCRLRDLGNTVIVVEHDEDAIRTADYIVDIARAGVHGGKVVAQGTLAEIMKVPESLTGQYLSGVLDIKVPARRRPGNGQKIVIKGAKKHNLKNIDVEIPLGMMAVITGVSGSGKSTLIEEILHPGLTWLINRRSGQSSRHKQADSYREIIGAEALDKVINIDQAPIGRTPRSNPATYTGAFTGIRELFAGTAEARCAGISRGASASTSAAVAVMPAPAMALSRLKCILPDVYIPCEVCRQALQPGNPGGQVQRLHHC